ncbi:hypothetical protein V8C37DRAFT_395799 [Trichoderma ceciliae]
MLLDAKLRPHLHPSSSVLFRTRSSTTSAIMTRGNQRELARAKNQKKDAKAKNSLDGYQQAKQSLSNAEIMRQKQAKADEKRKEQEEQLLKDKRDAKVKK